MQVPGTDVNGPGGKGRPAGAAAVPGSGCAPENSAGGDGRRSRWTQHREQRRVKLIGAAIEAVLAHGPDVDMAQVAEVAGVSKPVLYRYFADKYQLWTAVGEYVAQLVVDAVVPAVTLVREERGLIAATIDAYLGTIESYPDLYRVLVHQSGAQGVHHVIAASAQTVATNLAQVIGERLRALGLDAGPAEPWAYGMVGLVQTVGDWWIMRDQPIDRATLTDYLTTLLWQGISGVRATSGGQEGDSANNPSGS